jgi:predicted Kef-type K+ transport protein
MLAAWIGGALILGLLAWRVGLPPLVGFLVAGFAFSALGAESTPMLVELAHAGVLLLLFAVGLKLRLKTVLRLEVLGTAIGHLLLTAILAVVAIKFGAGLAWPVSVTLAVAVGFSSTVVAAKTLEVHRELRAVHGRIAIGILIAQDLVAVALLAGMNATTPSPYALLLLLLPLARPVLGWLLDLVGHGELLVLLGAVLALAVGGQGFESVGLSAELGALVLGMLLSEHKRAEELSNALWGLKELFLVGFFLNIGLSSEPTWGAINTALWLLLLLPLKGIVFFFLLLGFGLRARTSFLTGLCLTTYSEFGLIVVGAAVANGLLGEQSLAAAALVVAASFAIAAPLNAYAHALYGGLAPWLDRLERDKLHPDDEVITLGSAEILIVGMGRVGSGAYDYLRAQNAHIVGIDNDPGKLERNLREGRRVAYADAEDPSYWHRLNIDRLKGIMLAIPDVQAKLFASRELRRRGYRGLLSATHVYPEERDRILEAGCDVTYNYFSEAGVGFARHTWETLRATPGVEEPV